jgi:Flp pilus assembly protein TadD
MGMAIDCAVPDDEGQGCALAESGDYQAAVQCFRRATASGQGTAEVHEMLAQCLLETGKHEEALEAASSAVRLRPEVIRGFRHRLP